MKQQIKRVLSLLLVTCMIFCGLPADVYAVGESQAALETTVETTESETSAESTTNADESSDDTEAQESEKETTQTEAETTEKSVETTSAEKNTKSEESNYAVALTADEEASTTADTSTTETTSTIIAMSDYQNSSLSSDKKKTVPQTIVNDMVSAGVSPELVLLGGDYVDGSVGADGSNTSASKMATEFANLTGIIKSGWSSITDDKILAIQGNHDASQFLTDDTLDATGAYEYDNYIIYLINEGSFPWWQGGYYSYSDTKICKTAVTNTADDLETYLESLIEAGDHRPVIIMSHVPMHWSQRSTTGKIWWNDNIYADILFDVVNEAAKELDILFLFGHNHSSYSSLPGGYDNEIGGALAYVAKTESMKVPNSTNGTDNYTTKTLNFTYMNAGYVGNYNGSTKDCSISAITIDSDSIDIDRYTYNNGTVDNETIALTGGSDSSGDDESSNNSGSDEGTSTGTTTTGEWVELPASESGYEQITSLENISSTDKYLVVVWRYFGRDSNEDGYVFHDENNGNIKVTGSDGYATITSTSGTIDDGCYWYITNNGDGTITMKNADTGDYLGSNIVADSSLAVNLNIASARHDGYQNFSIGYNDGAIRYSNSNRKFSFSGNTTSSGASSANACNITLYKVVSASDGGYARLSGKLNQNYTTVSVVSEETVLGNVKVETSTDGSTVSETIDVTSDMVTWDTEFDGSTAGTYTGTVTYEGKELGEITVTITAKSVTNIELVTATGSVTKNSSSSAVTGGKIKVTYSDGTSEELDVTVGMLSGDNLNIKTEGTYGDLTVTYGGETVTGFTLTVTQKEGNNFPEYPDPGSVDVNKVIGDYSQFQNTGVAEVQLSTSGIPMNEGVDVVVVLDTSSSMTNNIKLNGKTTTRLAILRPAVNSLIEQLQAKREDGSEPDLDIAIVAFNGFTGDGNSSTQYGAGTYDDQNYIGNTAYATPNKGGYLTGTTDNAWVDIMDMSTTWATDNSGNNITTGSGTNYDEGLLMAYKLLAAKKASWENGETREQYVVFMSDGAPFQYNGVYSNYVAGAWPNWLLGKYAADGSDIPSTVTNKEYYNGDGEGNGQPHRIAEAIKGDPEKEYEIVTTTADENGYSNLETVYGLDATMYSIGYILKDDQVITAEEQGIVLKTIASSEDMYYSVNSAEELATAFSAIAGAVKMAATNAYFVDQMGDDFDIQMASTVTKFAGTDNETTITLTPAPQITISTYNVYGKNDIGTTINGVTVTQDMVGQRYGDATVVETVTFNADGTAAYSNGGTTNIISDGVICATNFFYNTTNVTKTITLADGTTYDLPAETFYWNIGTINETGFVLSYYVYLEGAAEGEAEAGTYDTNNYATLYYTNWLDNNVNQSVQSPALAWKSASVYYGFYLVDSEGKPVVNQTTGETGSFADAVKVTSKIFYKEVKLNSDEAVATISVDTTSVPEGYTVYDSGAVYTITVDSANKVSGWKMDYTKSSNTSYVTDYHGTDYSNVTDSTTLDQTGVDYTSTTVWFAVVWEPQCIPDTVVIDYGLPVDISVLVNDMFGNYGTLNGVGAESPLTDNVKYQTEGSEFGTSLKSTYGTANVNGSKVRYTPSNMQMDSYDQFAYEVKYTVGGSETDLQYYYGTVTVIPATTIYYEDSYLNYNVYDYDTEQVISKTDNAEVQWKQVGDTIDATQDEDRPGVYSLSSIDANNIYGYDSAYKEMSMYSMGSAMKVNVGKQSDTLKTYATAEFTFQGTGFDIISLTSDKTGTIVVEVSKITKDENADEETITNCGNYIVDTYYGYKWAKIDTDGDGNIGDDEYAWVIDDDAADALYQVPVIKVEDLDYGKYQVKITVSHANLFDHDQYDGTNYDFYLDAVRIYDPANDGVDNETIQNAYTADSEGWPVYYELRNELIDAATFDSLNDTDDEIEGIVFIDGKAENSSIADYSNYGPNNEVYLAPGQAVAFNMNMAGDVASIHLGLKTTSGSANYKVYDATNNQENVSTRTVSTATDMYYDITALNGKTVVIYNNSTTESILSITNIKVTYTSDPDAVATAGTFTITRSAAALALASLNEPAEPEVFEPEVEISLSNTSVTAGTDVTVTVTTSSDVEYVTINDTIVSEYVVGTDDSRVWESTITTEAEGELIVNVVAYNADDIASETVTAIITVTKASTTNNVLNWLQNLVTNILGSIFGKWN